MNTLTLTRQAGSLLGGLLRSPPLLLRAHRLLQAINAHDLPAAAALIGDGTLADPLLDAPVHGEAAVLAHLRVLLAGFPDLRIDYELPAVGRRTVAAAITLHGTHLGPIPGKLGFDEVPGTGRRIAVAAVMTLKLDDAGLPHARLLFDSKDFGQALGFQAFILPQRLGPYRFGAWYRRNGPSRKPPMAAGVTWLTSVDPAEYHSDLPSVVTGVVDSLCATPGNVGVMAGLNEPDENGHLWSFTLSLWDSIEATEEVLADAAHKHVVGMFMKEKRAYATHSRVFKLDREKPVMLACLQCGKKNNAHKAVHQCSACKAGLPPAPDWW